MSYLKNKVEYTDYEKMGNMARIDWRCPQVPDGLKDKLVMDKDLFFALLLNISSNTSDKFDKPLEEIKFVDIANYLYTNNLSEVVSMVRFYNNKGGK